MHGVARRGARSLLLALAGPGWAPRDVGALAAHVDVLPTLAALAGAALPEPGAGRALDGRSLVPFLEGRDDPWFAERLVFQHNARWTSGLAAQHKDCMAGVRWREYLLVRSRSCGEAACVTGGVSQCGALSRVAAGSDKATYTTNALFTWAVTPGDGWALFDVRKDPGCREDLAAAQKPVTERLLGRYNAWWEAVYPEMIAAGGDAPLRESAVAQVKGGQKKRGGQ